MTLRPDTGGSDWVGGRPRLNLSRSLGAFTRFAQVKAALLQGGVSLGITAILIGLDGLEIATFERQLDPLSVPEVRLYSQHIHADRIIPDVSFTVGVGEDIEFIPINGGGTLSLVEGVGVRTAGSGHILCRFAGFFRGPGFFVSAQANAGMDAPGDGAYMGVGFQYDGGAHAICGGVGDFPAGWYRCALIGDPTLPLSLTGVLFMQRKVADPLGTASKEGWQFHSKVFRGSGDFGNLSCGGLRDDGSDVAATANFTNSDADYGLTFEDRQLLLATYPAGGAAAVDWSHIHVSDTDKETPI